MSSDRFGVTTVRCSQHGKLVSLVAAAIQIDSHWSNSQVDSGKISLCRCGAYVIPTQAIAAVRAATYQAKMTHAVICELLYYSLRT